MTIEEKIIEKLGLQLHPEAGYFKETYRSKGEINPGSAYNGTRNYSTCIYFLLTSGMFSAFHRIKQDEIWHFYEGSNIDLHIISETGQHSSKLIGRDLFKGESPQVVVPGGSWFAAEVTTPNSFALVGCTVAPGFDFSDFELAQRNELTSAFPQHRDLIARFTR
ncbi:cupin domain-containing protein [Gramella sp. GC03-9]|uniref:Cupin domain-containing protein n=1 Tax=Christiangramia oceanisediminis TaxID=2920386 RepID=A0A9X2I363_9FLAO|nr:cupin domain-containing protein [Gramella oceanisediminis]MCP9199000.1 cupin domain-containing protein [Gramella oceanisediminis]